MDIPNKQPTSWAEYERGGRQGSFSSTGSHVQWDDLDRQTQDSIGGTPRSHLVPPDDGEGIRRRRSSIALRMDSIRRAGGVNSIDNFARSWQRAAGFYEIRPVRHSFRVQDEDDGEYRRQDVEASPQEQRGLLRDALHHEGRRVSESVVEDSGPAEGPSQKADERLDTIESRLRRQRSIRAESILSAEPSLASPFGGSYGTTYGSLSERVNESSMRHAGRLFSEQQMKGTSEPDKEREPLLVKRVEEDGKVFNVVVGQSTLPQTVFNSVNVLVGVGLLSLPLGIRYAGWLIGMVFFLFSAVITSYTAKLLAKCLDVDHSLITFADLAFVSFGQRARILTSIIFSLELLASCVALIVLFSDSLDALIPGWGTLAWKLICGIVLIPLAFMPLRLLSFTSVLGILCCFGITLAVFIDGFIKPHQPGSLREPADTYLFPKHWTTIPLSFGLLMAPWGGHSVFPNIYRDMRHPYKYKKGVNVTYIFTYFLDVAMAVVGYLMFGEIVSDEVTSNILESRGYPPALSVFIVVCIAIIPLTKVPLNARPIISTIEIFCGLDSRAVSGAPGIVGISGFSRGLLKFTVRIVILVIFVIIAIVFPSFDRIMALLGSVACFTICIILPLAFHLKLFGKEIPPRERIGNWVLIAVSSAMAIAGTVCACMPKELLGA